MSAISTIKLLAKEKILRIGYYKGYSGKRALLSLYEKEEYQKDKEILEVIQYIKGHKVRVYNYPFYEEYGPEKKIELHYCNDADLFYVERGSYRMYFPRSYDELSSTYSYRNRILEQDLRCPHSYEAMLADEDRYDVIIDAGASEGIFILDNLKRLEKGGRVIAIEMSDIWKEPLLKTLSDTELPEDKYCMIEKYLSDLDDNNSISLDGLLKSGKIRPEDKVLVKMDIEGAEEAAISGSKEFVSACKNVTILACTYHHHTAYTDIKTELERLGMTTRHSKGYMYFPPEMEKTLALHKEDAPFPELRRGMVRGDKNNMKGVQ